MAHVFTLEATDHLVPRWYSEGISVFEEWRTGPNPGVRIPMSVYAAIKDDRLLPIADLDEGFLRPTYEEQVIVSYMQAGLVCDFINRHFGPDKLRELLFAFRDGLPTEMAIETTIDMPTTEFDKAFAQFVDQELGTVLAQLDEWHQAQLTIKNGLAAGAWDEVIAHAERLIAIIPQYSETDSPYIALAHAHTELGDSSSALAALETYWRNGGYDPTTLRRLSRWLVDAKRNDDAIAVMQSINLVDPLDGDLHGDLGDLLLATDRAAEALLEYQVALFLQPHDMATAWYRLASAEHKLGNVEQSQSHLLQALDVAPNYRPAQRLLLQLAADATD
jgi:tetratricopeptide (TPR) repeat protein